MAAIAQQTSYQAFGLQLRSDLPLPELLPSGRRELQPDVVITVGDLVQEWESGTSDFTYFRVRGDRIWFAVPQIAIYRISEGREIVVSPLDGADERMIRLYLLGSCMGALLMQRGILPLHGSAVVVDGRAYAFVGESGAGKSTIAAAFAKQGFALLSDDVIALSFGDPGDGTRLPTVTPSYPQQKLWQESLEQLGMESGLFAPLGCETTKFAVPVPAAYCRDQVPLSGIFELLPFEKASQVEIRKLTPFEGLPLIGQHTYRQFLIPQLGLQDWHFKQSAILAGRTDLFRVRRPLTPFSAHHMVDRIIQTIREGA
jgi:hypothetical protein